MKLTKIVVRNFKGVRNAEFSTTTTSRSPRQLIALLGDNGSGKTSVLQAIALTLSLATRRTRDISSFGWHGFLPERVSSLGPTFVELDILFDPDEIAVTKELFEAWYDALPTERKENMSIVPPADYHQVTVRFERGHISSPQGFEAINQFLGRYYVKQLISARPELRTRFAATGDVFWFDQHRNLGSSMIDSFPGETSHAGGWQAGVEQLREYLVGWWGHHTTPQRQGKDYIEPLEKRLQAVFPGTRFVGIMPRDEALSPTLSNFYFLLDRDGRIYDLAEMSSGEQAVFPLVYEFVRLDIQKSIVLIDELELHLHPPEQQRLLSALPKIGSDCQFLITTHSEFLTSVIPNEQEMRLERGTLCL